MQDSSEDLPGVVETVEAIAAGRLTAEAALRARLERIDLLEPKVGAWVEIDSKAALAAAQSLDAGPMRGSLHGVPLAIKDIFAVRGLPWRCGSAIWVDRTAGFDAGCVALARAEGAVVLGKSETTEFAGYHPARTRNPFDPSRTPGGSSSGSAAAVACGMVPLALGTQTSGSIIRPASYCGVVGFKPSFDLIETGGVAPFARSLDTVGVFARSVSDAARGVEALSGSDLCPDGGYAPADLSLYRSAFWNEALPDLVTAWERFESVLARKVSTSPQRFAPDVTALLHEAPALHARIMALEVREALAHEYHTERDLMSSGLLAQIEEGRAMSPKERARDRRAMRDLRHLFARDLPADAVWLTPAATGPAPAFEDGTGNPIFNRLWSLLGLPCCTVPLLRGSGGHPIGVQVVGAMGNDHGVLCVADWLMRAIDAD